MGSLENKNTEQYAFKSFNFNAPAQKATWLMPLFTYMKTK